MGNGDSDSPTDKQNIIYAGSWVRLLAEIIDIFILGFIVGMLAQVINEPSAVFRIIVLIVFGIYDIYLNAHFHGTLGKRILGLELLDLNFKPLSYGRALLRFVLKFLLGVVLVIPTYVEELFPYAFEIMEIFAITFAVAFISMMFFNKYRQMLHDYFARTIVVDRAESDAMMLSKTQTDENGSQAAPRYWIPLKVFRAIGIFVVVAFVAYFLIIMFIFSKL